MPLGHSPSPQPQAALWGACSFLAEPALWGEGRGRHLGVEDLLLLYQAGVGQWSGHTLLNRVH